ncbi:long-chain acyl-CoA synthetase [Acetivibrio thermocellus AD2]|jgi:long-chain acyl-CoA synthetase|uniref:Long-chain acyl-CoA synthetase n=1 Tax=Acetivibrio thermocellus AD2 TaxID=1138384 RepID=A0AB36TFD0_ACETH|nr:AMP-binding protein [Acetivibrio thermocellus]ADU74092.1 AMP-dependent synthetase and ligase [Acetivibrio thermocellus DSM 1313]ALX08030.1 Long-chain-fatty-acid--CoA ligase [Acetivibrio thermocellus AD2]ANV75777.1 Long-chain-fatty-acid--CoA ligase [Acetivibrio thermocellus DSM 2360]EIC06050.1 AMP-dependent synthetase and ligase [Acetivibrio thermocellus YS]PFH02301.1 long-chain acyl-CoA synthetase [Acetivibrio thermocellus AD2]
MKTSPVFEVRTIKNLRDMIEQSSKLFANKDAFRVKTKDNSYRGITFAEFKNDIDAFGTALLDLLGTEKGFVAVIGENRYEWCVTYLATINGVGVVIPLDKELPLPELENLLKQSNANAIVYSGKFHDAIKEMSSRLSNIKYFINMNTNEHEDDKFLSFWVLLEKGKKLLESGKKDYLNAPIDENAMSAMIFTSGTTGQAKAVMLSHKNICSNMMAVSASVYMDSTDSVLSILPLHHTYECTAGFLTMIYNGATITFNEGLKYIGKNLKEAQPTILILVPLILESMYNKIWEQASKDKSLKFKLKAGLFISNLLYKVFKIDIRRKLFKSVIDNVGGKLRLVISGAAALDPEVAKGFEAMGIKVLQGYGLTEASPIVAVNRDKSYRHDSVGLPLPGLDVEIINPDKEGFGEIIVKGDSVMLGYYNNDDATKAVLKDGWLYTGDLGRMDEKGFIYITGRKKNIIVTKTGKNIFPEEVEAYLNKSPYIKESLVSGRENDKNDETIVVAQIVPDMDAIKAKLKTDTDPSPEEVYKLIKAEIRAINKNMPVYKRVVDITIRENEFAKTSSKKIKRYLEKTNV